MLGTTRSTGSGDDGGVSPKGTGLDQKAEQEVTGLLLDLVSISEANGLKLPRGEWHDVT